MNWAKNNHQLQSGQTIQLPMGFSMIKSIKAYQKQWPCAFIDSEMKSEGSNPPSSGHQEQPTSWITAPNTIQQPITRKWCQFTCQKSTVQQKCKSVLSNLPCLHLTMGAQLKPFSWPSMLCTLAIKTNTQESSCWQPFTPDIGIALAISQIIHWHSLCLTSCQLQHFDHQKQCCMQHLWPIHVHLHIHFHLNWWAPNCEITWLSQYWSNFCPRLPYKTLHKQWLSKQHHHRQVTVNWQCQNCCVKCKQQDVVDRCHLVIKFTSLPLTD